MPRSLLSSNQGEDAAAPQGILGKTFSLAQTGRAQLHKHTDAGACTFTVQAKCLHFTQKCIRVVPRTET